MVRKEVDENSSIVTLTERCSHLNPRSRLYIVHGLGVEAENLSYVGLTTAIEVLFLVSER